MEGISLKEKARKRYDDRIQSEFEILAGDVKVGAATCTEFVSVREDDEGMEIEAIAEGALIERLFIKKAHRGKGHGAGAILSLKELFGFIVLAAENADCARLYRRMGDDISDSAEWGELGQGFGVFKI